MLDFSEFFPHGSRSSTPLKGDGFLIHGDRHSGKTSFAFQAAINCVLKGGHVVVLCHESALYANIPKPFVPLSSLSEEALHRIEFIYVGSWGEAAKEMAAMRTVEEIPTLLIIDDDDFASAEEGKEEEGGGSMAIALSYLSNIADWMRRAAKTFHYVVVTNAPVDAVSDKSPLGGRLAPPYVFFPVVSVFLNSFGVVRVTPVAEDATEVAPSQLRWNDGLRLADN